MTNNPHRTEELIRELGTEIRNLRKDKGLTLDELSQRSGVSPNYLGSVEAGKRDVGVSTLAQVAEGLGVPVAAMFGFDAGGHELSPSGVEVAKRVDKLPAELRGHVLGLLRGLEG